ncbi:GPI alpha-1,4-mannosyltransferase I, stabilizing subunit-like [Crassostrea virginica]
MESRPVFILAALTTLFPLTDSSSPNLYRTLIKNGFHRDLFTKILIPSSLIEPGCLCLMEEEFPPGMYIDPYELKNLREKGGPQFSSPAVDIEKPKELSPSLKFLIYPPPFTLESSVYVTNVTIPVHLRYHQPSSSDRTVQVQLRNPRVYLLCDVKEESIVKIKKKEYPCSSLDKNCTWTEISYMTDAIQVEFEVPVGCLHHRPIVVVSTLGVTILSCLYLCQKFFIH